MYFMMFPESGYKHMYVQLVCTGPFFGACDEANLSACKTEP